MTRTSMSSGGAGASSLTPADLAGLLTTFNEVTGKLQSAHDALRNEVSRLTRELREANEQVERSRRLAALGEMAAGIAHEVRNPLGSVRLYATMLEEDLAGDPAKAALAGKINLAARAVEGIVGDVLSFARELRLRMEPVTVAELFERVLGMCEHERTRVDRLEVTVSCARSEVVCDAGLMTQALVNIVQNAMQAMAQEPGPHRLELSCAKVRGTVSGHRTTLTRIRVRDTGQGVTPEVVARMFNPFFTTRGTGTGLGLAIVHRIVDAHGGRIVVRNNTDVSESEGGRFDPARGACVDVLLPLSQSTGTQNQRHMRDSSAAVEVPARAGDAQELTQTEEFGRR